MNNQIEEYARQELKSGLFERRNFEMRELLEEMGFKVKD